MERREIPDVLALDRDPEADELAIDLADPEAVRIVAQRARAGIARKRSPGSGGRGLAVQPRVRARCSVASRTTAYVGREIGRRRAADDDPIESVGCRHLRHAASIGSGATVGRARSRSPQ